MTALRVERDGGLAVVTLEHPPLNLFDHEVFEALEETVGALQSEPPRAALFRAAGKVVSAGVDVGVFDGLSPEDAKSLWTGCSG